MENDLSNYRKSYEKGALLIKDTPKNPMLLFKQWFDEIDTLFPDKENNTMTISSLGLDGFPKNRIVLLKKIIKEGFIFFTNYNSEKGQAIANNPNVCLSFFWPELERQVIIKGVTKKTSTLESDTYFNSRPRGSQLGALASNQSEPIENRAILDNKLKDLEYFYKDKIIKRPSFWGGFLIEPITIEFWQGRPNRLHDRILYCNLSDKNWSKKRLSP